MKDLERIQDLRKEQERLEFYKTVFIYPCMMALACLIVQLAGLGPH